ncbi:MAG: heavy-metal-associated domain-containing protein [Pirellulales bacterium]
MFRLASFKMCCALVAALVSYSAATIAFAQQSVFKVQIVADDMCCQGCAQKVAAQLYAAPGVTTVEADVPNRLVTVTAKPSPKLTVERIWFAVEKGKGGPSKLVTADVTYVLTRPDKLKPEQRLPVGRYSLEVRSLQYKETAQKIANQLHAIQGVENVSVNMAQRTLFVQTANGALLSPFALASAADRAQSEPIAIGGPYGVMTIERADDANPATAVRPTYPQVQGEVR